jgi:hypothetical protein
MNSSVGQQASFIRGPYQDPGPNQVVTGFNFPAFASFDTTSQRFVSMSQVPAADSFPLAERALFVPQDSAFNVFDYNSSGIHELGQEYIGSAPGVYVYQNPRTILPFPSSFGSSSNDSFFQAHTDSSIGQLFSYGTVDFTTTSAGSIVTPFGTYNNAVRVTSFTQLTDSIVDSIGTFTVFRTETKHTWYEAGNPFPVVESVVRDFGFFQDSFSVYQVAQSTGRLSPATVDFVTLSPTPARSHVDIAWAGTRPGTVYCRLLTLGGMILSETQFQAAPGHVHSYALPAVAKGLYWMQFDSPEGRFHERVLIQ